VTFLRAGRFRERHLVFPRLNLVQRNSPTKRSAGAGDGNCSWLFLPAGFLRISNILTTSLRVNHSRRPRAEKYPDTPIAYKPEFTESVLEETAANLAAFASAFVACVAVIDGNHKRSR